MTHFFLFLSFLIPLSPNTTTQVEWLTPTVHEFGDIAFGKTATTVFKFKNTGNEAFVIDNVRTSCDCTASEWEETPIEPGKEGKIKVEFDAKKTGYFKKKLTVYFSGLRQGEKLYVEGFVE
jgi:hypothetical protein